MRRTTTVVLTAAALALAGCSSSDDNKPPKATVTVTNTPKLSKEEARTACVRAWRKIIDLPDTDENSTPAVCKELDGQADMYMEALRQRNDANRARMDACLEDPSCTSLPIQSARP